jgi:protein TonB
MVNNNVSRASMLEFATSFDMDNSMIKKSYLVSLLLVTMMFFIVFPERALELPKLIGDEPRPKPIDPRPWPPRVPPHNTVFINTNAQILPDPAPNEPEIASEYIPDDDMGNDPTYEGDWTYEPEGNDARQVVKVSKPECYEKTQPYYPELARKAGIEGTVVVKIIIGTDSRIAETTVLNSPGKQFGFDDAALNAVKQWRCNPAMIDGRKMETEGIVSVNFRITR